jgi:outer membrane receptor protein involved in Fe transport
VIVPVLFALFLGSQSPAAGAAVDPAAAQASQITGTVVDSTGRVVAGAAVEVRSGADVLRRTSSGPDGRFSLPRPEGEDLTLVVLAGGFAEARRALPASGTAPPLDVRLEPSAVTETVTVTATRTQQRTGDLPASVSVVTREEIQRSPAVVADDVLRQLPTFSLFRRTSSLAAHPTAQGVSLRGIGPSGVSRTLVLLDGVPFNDPFGGWVYWTRVPLDNVSRIEVVDNSSSSLYGNYAMGGVINVVTQPPVPRSLEVRTQYGNLTSPKFDVTGSDVWGRVGVRVDASAFSTDGYPLVAEAERGPIDRNAAVKFQNVNAKLQYDHSERLQASVRVGYFHEDRDNGKVSTFDGREEANDTTWKTVSGSVRLLLPDQSTLQITGFGDVERFHSNFLAVPAATPPRSVGRISLDQVVPTDSAGASAQWSRGMGRRQFLTLGADWRWVDGDSREQAYDAVTGTRVTLNRVSGGAQQSAGFFVQDLITPVPRLLLSLSTRVDTWRTYDGHNLETTVPEGLPGPGHDPSLASRSDTVASPRLAARYRLTDQVSVWGDLGWGFRAPTLNELYRQFRVGTVLTLANNQLGPERSTSGELGVSYTPVEQATLRATWYDNRIENAVSNVTISSAPGLVTQQRQNLGRTRIRGLQTDAEYRIGRTWRVLGAYLFNRARVVEFAENPSIEGNFLPQVPEHRGSIEVDYLNDRLLNVSVGVLAFGRQFDDDQNTRGIPGASEPGLPGYATVSLSAWRPIARSVDLFVGAQNLFDRTYYVGTLPTTVGTPRLVNVGVRVRLGASRP